MDKKETLNCSTDKCKNIRLLLFDNNNKSKVLYDSNLHPKHIGKKSIKKYNVKKSCKRKKSKKL